METDRLDAAHATNRHHDESQLSGSAVPKTEISLAQEGRNVQKTGVTLKNISSAGTHDAPVPALRESPGVTSSAQAATVRGALFMPMKSSRKQEQRSRDRRGFNFRSLKCQVTPEHRLYFS